MSESELNDKSLHDNSAVCSSFSPTVSVRVRRGREWWARGGGGEGGEGAEWGSSSSYLQVRQGIRQLAFRDIRQPLSCDPAITISPIQPHLGDSQGHKLGVPAQARQTRSQFLVIDEIQSL